MIERRIKRKVKREIQFYKVSICWFYVLYTFITWINMQFFQNDLLTPSSFCLHNPAPVRYFSESMPDSYILHNITKAFIIQGVRLYSAKNIDKWEWKSQCRIIQGNRLHRCWIRQSSLYIIMCLIIFLSFIRKFLLWFVDYKQDAYENTQMFLLTFCSPLCSG